MSTRLAAAATFRALVLVVLVWSLAPQASAQEPLPAAASFDQALSLKLKSVDARLAELDAQLARHGFGLPITCAVASFGVAAAFGISTLGYGLVTAGNANEARENLSPHEKRVVGILGGVSLLGIAGGI